MERMKRFQNSFLVNVNVNVNVISRERDVSKESRGYDHAKGVQAKHRD
jgi:hypothetical protein